MPLRFRLIQFHLGFFPASPKGLPDRSVALGTAQSVLNEKTFFMTSAT